MTLADLSELGLVAVLVLINAVFAGSELALVSLRETQIARLAARSSRGAALARLAQDQTRFLATIQIGITMAGFLASATAAVSLAEIVEPALAPLGDAARVVAILLVTLVLTFVTLVFGELAPKRLAMQHAEGWALNVARPLDLLARIARPAIWALSVSTNLVVRVLGGDPTRGREQVTEEEIRDLVAAQASLTHEAQEVISGALEVGNRTLRDALVPRPQVFALSAELPVEEALERLLESGHTRAPVYRETIDEVLGIVSLRQLIRGSGSLTDMLTPVSTFPDSMPVLAALRDLQRRRQQLAIVVDEHGGLDGIVTIEDLVEEVVGEIYDEYDRDFDVVVREADGSIELPGVFPAHDMVDLGLELPEGPYSTIAGFLLDQLGHIPAVGETVEVQGWRLTAAEMNGPAITRVHVSKPEPAEDEQPERP